MADKADLGQLPPRDATSDQIRAFFVRCLVTAGSLSSSSSSSPASATEQAEAGEITGRWPRAAGGAEVWTFSLQTYCTIFGKADGMTLWSRVHGVGNDDKRLIISLQPRERAHIVLRCLLTGYLLVVAAIFTFAAVLQGMLPKPTLEGIFCLAVAWFIWVYA